MALMLDFEIRFHSPFRVAAGTASDGVDIAVDPDEPLPASSLKGVTRHAAGLLLGDVDHPAVIATFGGRGSASPWAWSDARLDTDHEIVRRAQVGIDPATGSALRRGLFVAEQVETDRATFRVSQIASIPPDARDDHVAVLVVATQAVHSLGGARRRGLGWVGVRSLSVELDAVLARFESVRAAS